jgi:hypothetical protein
MFIILIQVTPLSFLDMDNHIYNTSTLLAQASSALPFLSLSIRSVGGALHLSDR